MKQKRMKLRLLKSQKMDNEGIHDVIRMSRAAREHFCPSGSVLCVTVGSKEFVLRPRRAFSIDISRIKLKYNVGFVTSQTLNKIKDAELPKNNSIWLSEHLEDLVVGSDPEFGLIDEDGLYVYASSRLPNKHETPFGTDGPCMEIRAAPSSNVEKHAGNIRELIKEGSSINEVKNLRWWTGATYKAPGQDRRYAIGGHIHIGDPRSVSAVFESESTRHTIQRRIIRVLDEILGLPLTRIDNPYAGWRRKNTGYGGFGDFRSQNNRLEWRTPSALWLTHPDLAISVIGSAKAVVEECYLIMEDKKFDIKWVSAALRDNSFLKKMGCVSDDEVRDKLNESKPTSVTNPQLQQIYKRLRGMSTCSKYKAYIDEFVRITSLSEEDAKNIRLDKMRENWLANGTLLG